MQARHIRRFCKLDEKGDQLLEQVTDKLGLSARSFTRILKLARTIAGLAGEERIITQHLSEAIQYRGGIGRALDEGIVVSAKPWDKPQNIRV